ncbi:MAG: vWA domain-containing protein [Pirellulaceae bacterium]
MAIADGLPGVNPYFHDRDRPAIAARTQAYEEAGDFGDAVELVRDRLTKPISPQWKATLNAQLPELYQKAGIQASTPIEQVRFFELAEQAMRLTGQDSSAVQSLLEQAKRDAVYVARLDAMRDNHQWHDLIAELDVAIKAPQPWRHPFAELLIDACINAGEAAESLQKKMQLFSHAVQVAEDYALDPSHATALLANAQQAEAQQSNAKAELKRMLTQAAETEDLTVRLNLLELAADFANRHELETDGIQNEIRTIRLSMMPRVLPAGTTARLLGVEDRDPFVLVDFVVRGADGVPIMLDAKDIPVVSVAGKPAQVESIGVAPDRNEPLYTVLCLDYSASTKGEPQKHARRGALELFRSVDAEFQLVAFSDKVWNLSNKTWHADPDQLATQLDSLPVGGGTLLVAGLDYAARRFPEGAHRPTVVLLSDGVDSRKSDPAKVLDYCATNGITVHVIGLRGGNQFDAANLQRIANSTGGRYLEATQAAQLVPQFVQAAAEIRQRPLRLICKTTTHGPVELTIGRGNSVIRLISR